MNIFREKRDRILKDLDGKINPAILEEMKIMHNLAKEDAYSSYANQSKYFSRCNEEPYYIKTDLYRSYEDEDRIAKEDLSGKEHERWGPIDDFCRMLFYEEKYFCTQEKILLSQKRMCKVWYPYLTNAMIDCFDNKTYCYHCELKYDEENDECNEITGEFTHSYCEWIYYRIGIIHNEECEYFQVCGRYFVSKCDDCGYQVAKTKSGEKACCYYFSNVLNELIDTIDSISLNHVVITDKDFNKLSNFEKQEVIEQEQDYNAREYFQEASADWAQRANITECEYVFS